MLLKRIHIPYMQWRNNHGAKGVHCAMALEVIEYIKCTDTSSAE